VSDPKSPTLKGSYIYSTAYSAYDSAGLVIRDIANAVAKKPGATVAEFFSFSDEGE
jgi:hypothetical protein